MGASQKIPLRDRKSFRLICRWVSLHLKLLIFVLYGLLLALAYFLEDNPWGKYRVEASVVWDYAQVKAEETGLDPLLIYSIVWAESSLNAHARTSVARGIMQMTEPAWKRVSKEPWRQAYDWRLNMDAGSAYLALLKKEIKGALEKEPSNAQIAGAYRYGFTRLKGCQFDPLKLPKTNNKIYKKLFAGELPEISIPELKE
ncbi:MAG: lytic transglycosylase domain-containing protein [Opitutales bacterium]|nr:lytic transglycosylase domain-containing protein [Opitutales bacterium]